MIFNGVLSTVDVSAIPDEEIITSTRYDQGMKEQYRRRVVEAAMRLYLQGTTGVLLFDDPDFLRKQNGYVLTLTETGRVKAFNSKNFDLDRAPEMEFTAIGELSRSGGTPFFCISDQHFHGLEGAIRRSFRIMDHHFEAKSEGIVYGSFISHGTKLLRRQRERFKKSRDYEPGRGFWSDDFDQSQVLPPALRSLAREYRGRLQCIDISHFLPRASYLASKLLE